MLGKLEPAAILFVIVLSGLAAGTAWAAESPHGDLDLACSECHSVEGWTPLRSPLSFDHETVGWPLDRAHGVLACRACHGSPVFAFVGVLCADCHRDPHEGELGLRCETCHDTGGWENQRETFDAHATTLFPLLASHASLDCGSCHDTSRPFEYSATPIDCYACHEVDFSSTTSPDHVANGFDTECTACHGPIPTAWDDATFLHPATFPLLGGHGGIPCESCHSSSFEGTPSECVACHLADYQATRDPDHIRSGLGTSCETCHSINAWQPASFDHARTGFPLQGAHRPLDCAECHVSGAPDPVGECWSCHAADYRATREPDHEAAQFPTTCDSCHGQDAWQPASGVDHDTTNFPLIGAHRTVDCSSCHSQGYAGTPTQCVSCHRADYDTTRDPNHAAAGYPTTCDSCHGQDAWRPASGVDHDTTNFPLTGAHRTVDCSSCHSQGYAGTPTECSACHQATFDATRDPDHRAAGFPPQCESCHSTNAWVPANWDHDALFPIYSGEHRNEWNACSDCHLNPSNYSVFSCVDCHEHNRSEMDGEHRGISGYVYESMSCYSCHPTGRE